MTRYTQSNPGGASMSGPVYEPQVTPYDRDSDDFSVVPDRRASRDTDNGPYETTDYGSEPKRRGRRTADTGDAWNRRDLTPTYTQDIEDMGQGRKAAHKARKAQPWDNHLRKRSEDATAGYGELADSYRQQGQYRQPWDDYLSRKK